MLDTEKSKMEVTVVANGKLKDVGDVNIIITYWNIRNTDGTLYGEGQGVITVKDSGNEMAAAYAKVKEYGVGRYSSGKQQHHHKQTIWRGSAFYQPSSFTSKFSFLNNIVGVFETEVDDELGNVIQKVWEWK